MARTRVPKDRLRTLLDQLAELVVRRVLTDNEATPREMSDVLKVAGGYWSSSRKNEESEETATAWSGYAKQMAAKDKNGSPN